MSMRSTLEKIKNHDIVLKHKLMKYVSYMLFIMTASMQYMTYHLIYYMDSRLYIKIVENRKQ